MIETVVVVATGNWCYVYDRPLQTKGKVGITVCVWSWLPLTFLCLACTKMHAAQYKTIPGCKNKMRTK